MCTAFVLFSCARTGARCFTRPLRPPITPARGAALTASSATPPPYARYTHRVPLAHSHPLDPTAAVAASLAPAAAALALARSCRRASLHRAAAMRLRSCRAHRTDVRSGSSASLARARLRPPPPPVPPRPPSRAAAQRGSHEAATVAAAAAAAAAGYWFDSPGRGAVAVLPPRPSAAPPQPAAAASFAAATTTAAVSVAVSGAVAAVIRGASGDPPPPADGTPLTAESYGERGPADEAGVAHPRASSVDAAATAGYRVAPGRLGKASAVATAGHQREVGDGKGSNGGGGGQRPAAADEAGGGHARTGGAAGG